MRAVIAPNINGHFAAVKSTHRMSLMGRRRKQLPLQARSPEGVKAKFRCRIASKVEMSVRRETGKE